MRNKSILLISFLLIIFIESSVAQTVFNSNLTNTNPSKSEYIFEARGMKFEVVPNRRARSLNKKDQFDQIESSEGEIFTSNKLGVIINHGTGVESATTGEITFKLKSGFSLSSIQPLLLPNVLLVMKPDIYVVKCSTPIQLVMIAKQLSTSNFIEWAEPYIVQNINSKIVPN